MQYASLLSGFIGSYKSGSVIKVVWFETRNIWTDDRHLCEFHDNPSNSYWTESVDKQTSPPEKLVATNKQKETNKTAWWGKKQHKDSI